MPVKVIQNTIAGIVLSVIAAQATDAGTPLTSTGTVVAANGHVFGVAMQTVETSQDVAVAATGYIEMVAGGAITVLDYVKVGSSGKVLTASNTDLTNGKVIGKAMATAGADGDNIMILLGSV